jgi:hypothetical protein
MACSGDEVSPEEALTINRELFLSTYIDLRVAALGTDSGKIGVPDRARILAEKGVSEEDLLEFVEVHGRNIELMSEIWTAVDSALTTLRLQADSSYERSTP